MNKINLSEKNAIVTGAYQGIGNEIAETLAEYGANVLLADINENVHGVAKQMNDQYQGQISSYCANLTNKKDIIAMTKKTVKEFNAIDVLVNNAGIMQTKPFMDIKEEEWDQVLATNLKVAFLISQQVVQQMRNVGNAGSIINIASIAGRSGRPLAPHYAASKAGMISLTKSMAEAFGKEGIRTNAICPGVIRTPMMDQIQKDRKGVGDSDNVEEKFLKQIKLDRLGTPNDIANTVLFLSSSLSDYINGQTINVCGGYEMD